MVARIKAVAQIVSSTVFSVMLLLILAASTVASAAPFTRFESGQVWPLALSPSGRFLYAVTTLDSRIEVFQRQAPSAVLVKFDGTNWRNVLNRTWTNKVRFFLPDQAAERGGWPPLPP